MKESKVKLGILAIVTAVAFLIAIPTLTLNFSNKQIDIRGLNPDDITDQFFVDDFALQSSVDLQGGKLAVFNVDLSVLPESQISTEFEKIKSIIAFRLSLLNIGDYELTALENSEKGEYKIVLKVEEGITDEQLAFITSRGEVEFWLEDGSLINTAINENGEVEEVEDPYAGTPFEGRSTANISNYDIFLAETVSDSRVYLAQLVVDSLPDSSIIPENSEQVSNYGLSVRFAPESNLKLLNALASNPIGVAPVLVTIDGVPVAYQASGNTYVGSLTVDHILLYTLVDDNALDNSIVASVMSSPVINFPVELESSNQLAPTLGLTTLNHMKIGLLLGFIMVNAVLVYYFRERSKFIVAANLVFLFWGIALLKIFGGYGLALSFPMLVGFLTAMLAFVTFVILASYRVRTKFSGGLTRSELQEVYTQTKVEFRNLTILFIISAFSMQRYGTITLEQYANGIGFGFVVALLVIMIAFPILMPFTFKLGKK